jgi:hypothetical protein
MLLTILSIIGLFTATAVAMIMIGSYVLYKGVI